MRPTASYFTYPEFPFVAPPELSAARASPWPVAIVGAGPAGLVAALELGRRGIEVVVLAADATYSAGSRAICISRRSMEILQQNGAANLVMKDGLGWTHGTSYWREHPVYRLEMPHSQNERFAPMVNIQQCLFEDALVRRVAQVKTIDLRWQSRVAGISQNQDGVSLRIESPGGPYTLQARYVLAADGARSNLRDLLGLKLAGESHSGRYLIADIAMKSDYPTERRAWFDPPSNRGATVLMHKQPRDIWRIDYQLREEDDAESELQPARIGERIGAHLRWIGERAAWRLEWASLYRAHCLCLDDYRHGNVFFLGDAAHLVPIFGVRGLNSAVADANNIGWKLAAVFAGRAPDRLLDSYSPERREATLDIFAQARKSTIFMTPPTRGYQLLRDSILQLAVSEQFARPLIDPRQSTPYDYMDSKLTSADADAHEFSNGPRPGAPLVNVLLSGSGANGHYLLDTLGAGFTLLHFGSADGAVAAACHAAAAELRCVVRQKQNVPADCIFDPEGRAFARYDAIEGTAYMARPDGHVAARFKHATSAAIVTALARARGEGTTP